METIKKKVTAIKEGDRVDLSSCPYLKSHPSAEYEYAEVTEVERETPDCIVIYYEGIDGIGYPIDQELLVAAGAIPKMLT